MRQWCTDLGLPTAVHLHSHGIGARSLAVIVPALAAEAYAVT
jgi:hypothetical protein